MKKIRYGFMVLLFLLLCPVTNAKAQLNVGIGIGLPNLSIGINLPVFPELTPVPGYPVYYAPGVDANYFFYDGMYWVYQDDNWYASSWYNGPWGVVEPYAVPSFVLRIPVRYYRQPPVYFRGWQSNAPPRWGQHWGNNWEQHRRGWDRWNRKATPARAPKPTYQRRYSGERYPRVEQQHQLHNRSYRYQARDKAVRQHLIKQKEQKSPAAIQRGRQESPPVRNQPQQQQQRQNRPEVHEQRPQAPGVQREEQRSHDRGQGQEQRGDRGQGRDKDDDRGRGRDK